MTQLNKNRVYYQTNAQIINKSKASNNESYEKKN